MTGVHLIDAKAPPGMRLYAIGDVHGRLDLLTAMLAQIDAQIAARAPTDWRIILLGDYVDRGPDSKGVLDLLAARQTVDPRLVLLCGNHDSGFLDFLEKPSMNALFARYGGRQTTASYGIDADFSSEQMARATRDALLHVVSKSHLMLLEGLRRSVIFGDFFFCHAGIRPGVALDRQDPEDLIWIRDVFLAYAGLHAKVIVHGHTPTDEPDVRSNRVNVDTLAYHSGRLTALVIDGAEKDIMTIEGGGA